MIFRMRVVSLLLLATLALTTARAQQPWTFAVSGDSRNCGDVVMPAIAAAVHHDQAAFYWHLGDFRAIYDFDQDYQQPPTDAPAHRILDYENHVWDDFLESQIAPFGDTTVYLGIGNHELLPPKTRPDFLAQFADWLDTPELKRQRLKDDPKDHRLHTYYHWQRNGIDFINLDNASPDQFDIDQLAWLERTLHTDAGDASIKTIVVGMHAALPDSISKSHSMSEGPQGEFSGRQVYTQLLNFQNNAHKNVYVLASHSHFFMDGVFNTEYWRSHGGVLPGWIIGTAGAVRDPLLPNAGDAKIALSYVYGYLLATVSPAGAIEFRFHPLDEKDIPADLIARFGRTLVHDCFAANRR
jgi:hypothetical protein